MCYAPLCHALASVRFGLILKAQGHSNEWESEVGLGGWLRGEVELRSIYVEILHDKLASGGIPDLTYSMIKLVSEKV